MTQKSAVPVYRDPQAVGTRDAPGVSIRCPSIRLPSICLARPVPCDYVCHSARFHGHAAWRRGSADPVINRIRSKLAEPGLRSNADPADVAALQTFYSSRAAPVWSTDMGLSARGQRVLFEIEKADDWGLDAAAFELPPAFDLPAAPDVEATTEIKLDLAILKYARFARGGRLNPRELSKLFDQAAPLRDPKIVLMEIAAAKAPDAYLQSLHPQHPQFIGLRKALLRMRSETAANRRYPTAHS